MANDETVPLFWLVILAVPLALFLVAHLVFGSRWKSEGKGAAARAFKYLWEDHLWYRMRLRGVPENLIRSRSNPNFGKTAWTIEEANVKIASTDPRTAFDTTASVLVYERMTTAGWNEVLAHRIYRNRSGEYFLVIASGGAEPAYVTHLSRVRAMDAFRDDPEAFREEFGDRGWWSFRRLVARKGGLGIQARVPPRVPPPK